MPANTRGLLLVWDPMIDGAFRVAFERALRDLDVTASDAEAVDGDPEEQPPLKLAIVSPQGQMQGAADMIVVGGRSDASAATPFPAGAFRLDTADIQSRARTWTSFRDALARKLERQSLTLAPEDLAGRLDAETLRADEAERARATFEVSLNTALRDRKQAEALLASARARIGQLEAEIDQLSAHAAESLHALSRVPESLRACVSTARDHAARARMAAAQAMEAAERLPDALVWPKQDGAYSGETRDGKPDGAGEMTIRDGAKVISSYRGQFQQGVRHGHGVAVEADGHVWCGQWAYGEAVGFGVLDAPDGRRFEGETARGDDGAPRRRTGYVWPAPHRASTPKSTPGPAVHTPRSPLLPAPETASR